MAPNFKKWLGLTIRTARQRAGLTQEDLAAKIARTPESVSNIERGIQMPSLETLIELGLALDVPVADFFEELDGAHNRSKKRIELEVKLRDSARLLKDRDLAVALVQIQAFVDHDA